MGWSIGICAVPPAESRSAVMATWLRNTCNVWAMDRLISTTLL